jgi:hypothetical protein
MELEIYFTISIDYLQVIVRAAHTFAPSMACLQTYWSELQGFTTIDVWVNFNLNSSSSAFQSANNWQSYSEENFYMNKGVCKSGCKCIMDKALMMFRTL